MKDEVAGTASGSEPTSSQALAVSERKLKANRENAKKSTGPKTARGKAYSRRNALKHGVCAKKLFLDFMVQRENSEDYRNLLDGLRRELKPQGTAEEYEVESIAQCYWREQRVGRRENAEVKLAQDQVSFRAQVPVRATMTREHLEATRILKAAEKDYFESKEVNLRELKERVLKLLPSFQKLWLEVEKIADGSVEPDYNERVLELVRGQALSEKEVSFLCNRAALVKIATIRTAIQAIEVQCEHLFEHVKSVAYDLKAIPCGEALDQILRYRAATNRELTCHYDRLKRLQRRRIGKRRRSCAMT